MKVSDLHKRKYFDRGADKYVLKVLKILSLT